MKLKSKLPKELECKLNALQLIEDRRCHSQGDFYDIHELHEIVYKCNDCKEMSFHIVEHAVENKGKSLSDCAEEIVKDCSDDSIMKIKIGEMKYKKNMISRKIKDEIERYRHAEREWKNALKRKNNSSRRKRELLEQRKSILKDIRELKD